MRGALQFWFLSFFLSFLVLPLLSSHCRCRGLLLQFITFNDTHSVRLHWKRDRTVAEASASPHTILTRDRHPYPRRDSNPQSHQANFCRFPSSSFFKKYTTVYIYFFHVFSTLPLAHKFQNFLIFLGHACENKPFCRLPVRLRLGGRSLLSGL